MMGIPNAYLPHLWYGAAAALLLGVAISVYILLMAPQTAPAWHRYLDSLKSQLDRQNSKFTPLGVVGCQLGMCGLLLSAWLLMGHAWAPLLCLGVVPATFAILQMTYARRRDAITIQLDGWLLMLSNMLRTTGSVGAAIRGTMDLSRAPLRDELEILIKHVEVGTPLESALDIMYRRTPSRGLRTVVTSLSIGKRLGGNLPDLLAENAATLRESQRIDAFIRSQVSQGKAQMLILSIAPAGFIIMLDVVTPGFFAPLVSHQLAPVIYVGCSAMWIAAILIGFRIMNVDA